MEIAVVGMACRFPGGIEDVAGFWEALAGGRDLVSDRPPERFDLDSLYDPRPGVPGRVYCRAGGFLDQIADFDAGFFGIAPREAVGLDPQSRLMLETAWEAVEDAGVAIEHLQAARVGVYVGVCNSDYGELYGLADEQADIYAAAGGARSMVAGRVSYGLGLRGPSLSLDTACSSSLVALHLAAGSIRSGECDAALAGGANLLLRPELSLGFAQARMLSQSGRCRFADAEADGFVRSEGVGAVLLKPLEHALAEGDRVYAVVLGSAVNNDGLEAESIMKPERRGQERVLRSACSSAGIAPSQLDYVEAHGTGTRVGDPIELSALAAVLGPGREPQRRCRIGSVKSNLGHTEGTAGIAGFIKTALCLNRRQLPPSLHVEELTPDVDWSTAPLRIVDRMEDLPANAPTFAGVSSFGIVGTNSHAILRSLRPEERHPCFDAPQVDDPLPLCILPISARSEGALRLLADAHRSRLRPLSWQETTAHAAAAAQRRDHHRHRALVAASDREELLEALSSCAAGETHDALTVGRERAGAERGPVFVFGGQGSQWVGMGRELYARARLFRAAMDRCERVVRQSGGFSTVAEMNADARSSRLDRVDAVQPMLFAVQYSLASLWRGMGVRPAAVIGHSLGEIGAAAIAGALSLEDAARVVCTRSRMVRASVSGAGGMAFVEASMRETESLLEPWKQQLVVAAENAPRASLIAGANEALDECVESLQGQGVYVRRIDVDYASHSPFMDELCDRLPDALSGMRPQAGEIPLYSTVVAGPVDGEGLNGDYWAENMRTPVRFRETCMRLIGDGYRVFIEVTPHPVLTASLDETLQAAQVDGRGLGSLRRDQDQVRSMARALGEAYCSGVAVDFERWFGSPTPWRALPRYPWQRSRFWFETSGRTRDGGAGMAPDQPSWALFGRGRNLSTRRDTWVFDARLDPGRTPYLSDHRLDGAAALPGAATIEAVLRRARQCLGDEWGSIENLRLERMLPLTEGDPVDVQLVLDGPQQGSGHFTLSSRHDESWTVHARGGLRRSAVTVAEALDPASLRSQKSVRRTGLEHYERMAEMGFDYGPSFQTVRELWIDENGVLGRLGLPLVRDREPDRSGVHPALLDGAMQLLIALPCVDASAEPEVHLPVAAGRITRLRPPGPSGWGWIHEVREADDEIVCNLDLLDDHGRVAVRVEDLLVRRLRLAAARTAERFSQLLYSIRRQAAPLEESTRKRQPLGPRLIFVDPGDPLEKLLVGRRKRCVRVACGPEYRRTDSQSYSLRPNDRERYARLLEGVCIFAETTPRVVVHAWSAIAGDLELDEVIARGCLSVLYLVQALAARDWDRIPTLCILTRQGCGAENGPVRPDRAMLWGLARVICHELPELDCRIIDLPETMSVEDRKLLSDELRFTDGEPEIVIRNGRRFVHRLLRGVEPPAKVSVSRQPASEVEEYRLSAARPGDLAEVDWFAHEGTRLAASQVRVRVRAASFNFVDVMRAHGLYPEMEDGAAALGGECSGEITALGAGVTGHRVGDRVVALAAGSLAKSVTVDARACVPIPDGCSFERAAAVPLVTMTVLHALRDVGALQPQERILIHSAAGGVGLAAVALARSIGAEVLATAGSEEKRAHLRSLGLDQVMDSRSLDFAAQTLAATGGAGVDVVLNSLTGEAIQAGLSVLAPGGRFVDFGKRDIYEDLPIGLAAFKQGRSLLAVDLDDLLKRRPERARELLQEAMDLLAEGRLGLLQHRTVGAAAAAEALRDMARARHVGKLVVDLDDPTLTIRERSRKGFRIRPQRSYLITGGHGGLGREVAAWLVDRGATHLALLDRSTPEDDELGATLRCRGCTLESLEVDVADVEDLQGAFDRLGQEMPPLAGVVHAAGVLDDRTLERTDSPSMLRVLAPKVMGGWNLHRLTEGLSLDFFVSFSSAASLLGSPGQGNYCAANAFLDALALMRRRQGLPALTVNWGRWLRVGLAAEPERARRLEERGLAGIEPEEALAALKHLLDMGAVQAAVMPLNVKLWCKYFPSAARAPLLERLRAEQRVGGGGAVASSGFLRELSAASGPEDRRAMLVRHLQEQLAAVLHSSAEEIGPDASLAELGLDSLMAVELRSRLEASLGVFLSTRIAWERPSVAALAEELLLRIEQDRRAGRGSEHR